VVGPIFNFGFTPNDSWHMSSGRWWFEVLPGIVAALGGLMLIVGTNRIFASIGGWLAAAAGGWFVVGPTLQPTLSIGDIGVPIHTSPRGSAIESLTMFVGLGALMILIAAWALGALAVVGVRDVRHARTRAIREREMQEAAVVAELRRREMATKVDEPTRQDTVVLPKTPAHAGTSMDDTTQMDRSTP
jgi:hypothetical protein